MTLDEFKLNLWHVRWLVALGPLFCQWTGNGAAVSFPPIGDDSAYWAVLATVLTGVAGAFAYVKAPKHWKGVLAVLSAAVLFAIVHLVLRQSVVTPIHYADGHVNLVTRGTARLSNLPAVYVSMNDEELIEAAGQHDADLADVYQLSSLRWNRQILFWTYTGFWGMIQYFLGSVAALPGRRGRSKTSHPCCYLAILASSTSPRRGRMATSTPSFLDMDEGCRAGFVGWGHVASSGESAVLPNTLNIVVGTHLLDERKVPGVIPLTTIVYNLEQLGRLFMPTVG